MYVLLVRPNYLTTELYRIKVEQYPKQFGRKVVKIINVPHKSDLTDDWKRFLPVYKALFHPDLWDKLDDGSGGLFNSNPQFFCQVYSYIKRAGIKLFGDVLTDAYIRTNAAYHNGKDEDVFLTDKEFDSLKEIMEANGIAKEVTKKVGAPIENKRAKVKLPHVMGSLEKVKTKDTLLMWMRKKKIKQAVVMPKIDGISVQLIYEKGTFKKGYTRGDTSDGVSEGQDITRHLKNVPSIPQKTDRPWSVAIRAELVMPLSVFKKKYARTAKNPKGFANPRNMIAGLFNRNDSNLTTLKDVQAIAYHIFKSVRPKTNQLAMLKAAGFITPPMFDIGATDADATKVHNSVAKWRASQDYEMDGVVVEADNHYDRERIGNETNSDNPAYGRAYKIDDGSNLVSTEVLGVEWKLSKHGYIKPTVLVKGVTLSGVLVQRATGFNGAYIRDNKIGKGAIVELTRSGDVIPYIVRTIKGTKADMPDEKMFGEWDFNDTDTDIVVADKNHDDVVVQKTLHFFTTLGVEHFNIGLIKRFYDAGIKTIPDILAMTPKEMIKRVPGVQASSAKRISDEIHKRTQDVSLPILMYASGCFGRNFGSRKLTLIYKEYKDDAAFGWEGFSLRDIAAAVGQLQGFSFDTGEQFAKGVKPFLRFVRNLKGSVTIKKYTKAAKQPLSGMVVSVTGFRDKDLAAWVVANGGEWSDNLTKSTTVLLVKTANHKSDKVTKANKAGVDVMPVDLFKKKYNYK